VTKFDLPLHKAGPEVGKPRGFCFVGYADASQARGAVDGLNGLVLADVSTAGRVADDGRGNGLMADFASSRYCPSQNFDQDTAAVKMRSLKWIPNAEFYSRKLNGWKKQKAKLSGTQSSAQK
jgi:RNA recognition motif-containing protein